MKKTGLIILMVLSSLCVWADDFTRWVDPMIGAD